MHMVMPIVCRSSSRARNDRLEGLMHLYMMNRGVLSTPFHNMKLICPATTVDDIDLYLAVFGEFAREIAA